MEKEPTAFTRRKNPASLTENNAYRPPRTADRFTAPEPGRSPARADFPYPAYVPARIRRLRRAHRFSQRQIAEQMGVSQQTYSDYEHGRIAMHIEEFIRLARFYNVSVDFITGASNIIGEFPQY